MDKAQIIERMQKPARILRTVCTILFVFAIIGTAFSALSQLVMPTLAETMIEILDSAQVEQTEDMRASIELLEGYAKMPTYECVTLALYALTSGVASVFMFFFLKRLFASLAEERYSILRTEYATLTQNVAITMIASGAIDFLFSTALGVMGSTGTAEIESASLLIPGLLLLGVAKIYAYACRLQLINEQEAYENFRASEGDSTQSGERDRYFESEARAEEAQKEEKSTFEGF